MFAALALFLLAVTEQQVRTAITPLDKVGYEEVQRLKAFGPDILPHLVQIYTRSSSEEDRAAIARIFYTIGWKSPEARAVLLKDVHTQNQNLRLHVQWALGRVSDDTEVVDILANIMMNDPSALFRDKAACALAYDQIHLTEKQKVRLYAKVIDALSDPKQQVRAIAIQVLQIHTGQTKGFDANGSIEDRGRSINRWKTWVAEYAKNL
jgi:hypothetical protein